MENEEIASRWPLFIISTLTTTHIINIKTFTLCSRRTHHHHTSLRRKLLIHATLHHIHSLASHLSRSIWWVVIIWIVWIYHCWFWWLLIWLWVCHRVPIDCLTLRWSIFINKIVLRLLRLMRWVTSTWTTTTHHSWHLLLIPLVVILLIPSLLRILRHTLSIHLVLPSLHPSHRLIFIYNH